MEYLSQILADYILKKQVITPESYYIYKYGFLCFLEMSISTIFSTIIALLLQMPHECLFFFIIFIPMRSLNGGLHLKNYFSCFLASVLVLLSTLLIVKYMHVPIKFSLIMYIICTLFILIVGPINHPNKSISVDENNILKRKTYFMLSLTSLIALILFVTRNKKYLLLLSIIFAFIITTSILAKVIQKRTKNF